VVAHVQEGVHVAVDGGDAVEVGLRRLDRRHLAGQLRGEVRGGQPDDVAHCSSPRSP
jgi:hypothetical protein